MQSAAGRAQHQFLPAVLVMYTCAKLFTCYLKLSSAAFKELTAVFCIVPTIQLQALGHIGNAVVASIAAIISDMDKQQYFCTSQASE